MNLAAVERALDRLGRRLEAWWLWPALLVALGLGAWVGALASSPVGEDVRLLGFDLFGDCTFRARWGLPCASCGMTRAWVQLVRGELVRAITYNPAGVALFAALSAGALVGGLRLALRRPSLLRVPWRLASAGVLAWFSLYFGAWVARLLGWLPLP